MDDKKESKSLASLQKGVNAFISEKLDGKNNYIIIAFLIVAFVRTF